MVGEVADKVSSRKLVVPLRINGETVDVLIDSFGLFDGPGALRKVGGSHAIGDEGRTASDMALTAESGDGVGCRFCNEVDERAYASMISVVCCDLPAMTMSLCFEAGEANNTQRGVGSNVLGSGTGSSK